MERRAHATSKTLEIVFDNCHSGMLYKMPKTKKDNSHRFPGRAISEDFTKFIKNQTHMLEIEEGFKRIKQILQTTTTKQVVPRPNSETRIMKTHALSLHQTATNPNMQLRPTKCSQHLATHLCLLNNSDAAIFNKLHSSWAPEANNNQNLNHRHLVPTSPHQIAT